MREWRREVAVMTSVVLLLSGCSSGGSEEETPRANRWEFESRPDLEPPVIEMSGQVPDEDLFTFIGPKNLGAADEGAFVGGLILDEAGEPVWVHETTGPIWDLRVQEYQGKDVLTFWEGEVSTPESLGEVVMLDDSYTEIARVGMAGDFAPDSVDLHETTITPEGTMLLVAYVRSPADLSPLGGPEAGWVWEGVVQEVDIATGELLYEWRSLEDVPIEATQVDYEEGTGTEADPVDYIHVNSVVPDEPGTLLVSGRNTHSVYQLDTETQELNWVLGGSASDFTMPEDAVFAWQHDAARQPDGTLTMFDNQAGPKIDDSRGLRLALDEEAMTASVLTEYLPPDGRVSASQGNLEQLPGGNVVIGWGSAPYFSEYSADGTLLWDASFVEGSNYRTYRLPWTATPAHPPAATAVPTPEGTRVSMSWNGATEVAKWRVLSGPSPDLLKESALVERTGFETQVTIEAFGPAIVVEALDADGESLGSVSPRQRPAPVTG